MLKGHCHVIAISSSQSDCLKKTAVFKLFALIYCTVSHRQHSSLTEGIKWRSLTPHVSSHFSATLPRLRNSQLVQRTSWPSQFSFACHTI